MSNPEHNSARRMPILSITVQSTSASYLPTSACLSRPTKTLHFKSSFFALTRPRRSLRGATRRRGVSPRKIEDQKHYSGRTQKGAQGPRDARAKGQGAQRRRTRSPEGTERPSGCPAHPPRGRTQKGAQGRGDARKGRNILPDDDCSGLTQAAASQQQHTDSAHAQREAVKAPGVPGDVLRTRPAGVRRKGRRAQGTHGPKGRTGQRAGRPKAQNAKRRRHRASQRVSCAPAPWAYTERGAGPRGRTAGPQDSTR